MVRARMRNSRRPVDPDALQALLEDFARRRAQRASQFESK
jgi:hypothetical protein